MPEKFKAVNGYLSRVDRSAFDDVIAHTCICLRNDQIIPWSEKLVINRADEIGEDNLTRNSEQPAFKAPYCDGYVGQLPDHNRHAAYSVFASSRSVGVLECCTSLSKFQQLGVDNSLRSRLVP